MNDYLTYENRYLHGGDDDEHDIHHQHRDERQQRRHERELLKRYDRDRFRSWARHQE